jgi:hypothetical protein
MSTHPEDDVIARIMAIADRFEQEAAAQEDTVKRLGGPTTENAYHVGARDAYKAAAHKVRNLGSAIRLRR